MLAAAWEFGVVAQVGLTEGAGDIVGVGVNEFAFCYSNFK